MGKSQILASALNITFFIKFKNTLKLICFFRDLYSFYLQDMYKIDEYFRCDEKVSFGEINHFYRHISPKSQILASALYITLFIKFKIILKLICFFRDLYSVYLEDMYKLEEYFRCDEKVIFGEI